MSDTRSVDAKILKRLLERQQRANQRDGIPSLAVRVSRLDRAIALLVENQQALCDAMNTDFGNRSFHQSRMADIYAALESLKYAKKHVAQWMKPEKKKSRRAFKSPRCNRATSLSSERGGRCDQYLEFSGLGSSECSGRYFCGGQSLHDQVIRDDPGHIFAIGKTDQPVFQRRRAGGR